MKKAVMYGAGNIGRGFIGKVFSDSGYEVCFIDVVDGIVAEINKKKQYTVKLVSNAGQREEIVKNIRAVNGNNIGEVADAIFSADIMATAVGVNVLPLIVKPICLGLKKRFDSGKGPLNIIICENLIDAHKYLRSLIGSELGEKYINPIENNLGLVEASIGRMVPVMTDEKREGELLKIWVEPYAQLPVDREAFIGEIPQLTGLEPFSPFGFYIKRKLFIHNLGHSMCAYLGWQKGYEFIYECVEDEKIRSLTENAMKAAGLALNKEYQVPLADIEIFIVDLLDRFDNKALGDTVERVGKDPFRKLGRDDRLTGAALYCLEQGINPETIISGIAAGLRYHHPADQAAATMQKRIIEQGIRSVVEAVCGLNNKSPLMEEIIREFNRQDLFRSF